jgi:TM2 domain-containing membrane protein YozV
MYKIIGIDGQPYGPVSAEQIRRWLAENRANAHTLVQSEGSTEWKPLVSFPEFAADLKTPPPSIIMHLPNPRASNKIGAGICGILLGSLGIHKFILGYTSAGLIMLLVTLLSCGALALVVHLIGLIEGIIYLCKSDDEFVRIYVDNRREWF